MTLPAHDDGTESITHCVTSSVDGVPYKKCHVTLMVDKGYVVVMPCYIWWVGGSSKIGHFRVT